ncbi:MAG: Large-conductance mechanosensitive channel [Bacteroidota bacterium]|jgi:large conductance mechanosensitive channel
MGFIKEFKEFAMRGNVIDLAVGVIVGASFGKIVTALVDDVIMPPIGYILGGIDFANKKIVLQAANELKKIPEVAIKYGSFINTVIQFVIIAFCVFLLIKFINTLQRKMGEETGKTELSKDQKLLTEIRDLLKKEKR